MPKGSLCVWLWQNFDIWPAGDEKRLGQQQKAIVLFQSNYLAKQQVYNGFLPDSASAVRHWIFTLTYAVRVSQTQRREEKGEKQKTMATQMTIVASPWPCKISSFGSKCFISSSLFMHKITTAALSGVSMSLWSRQFKLQNNSYKHLGKADVKHREREDERNGVKSNTAKSRCCDRGMNGQISADVEMERWAGFHGWMSSYGSSSVSRTWDWLAFSLLLFVLRLRLVYAVVWFIKYKTMWAGRNGGKQAAEDDEMDRYSRDSSTDWRPESAFQRPGLCVQSWYTHKPSNKRWQHGWGSGIAAVSPTSQKRLFRKKSEW